MPRRSRNTLGKAASLFFGVLLPLACFAVNEMLDPLGFARGELRLRGLGRWLSYGYSPPIQRFLYPLVLWSMLSLIAELFSRNRRFRPWVRAGLKVGVATAGAFSLWYVVAFPLALAGISAYGVGLLGLAPFPTLVTYVLACRANSAAARSGSAALGAQPWSGSRGGGRRRGS